MEKERGSQGDMYQIFNRQSLGVTEQEILKNVKVVTEKIVEQERLARKILTKRPIDLEDKVCRAYGVLSNSKKISSEECRKLLSDVKLGVDLGIITQINDLQVNKLQLYTRPGNLQKFFGEQFAGVLRDVKRSEVIGKIIDGTIGDVS